MKDIKDGDVVIIEGVNNGKPVILKEIKLELRCKNCGKLLAKPNKNGELSGEIKCNKCKTLNEV